MPTLQQLVNGYIGTTGAGSDTNSLNQWLTEGAQLLIMKLPDKALKPYATILPVTSGGIIVSAYRILEVYANNYHSIEFPAGMKAQLTDPDSVYFAIPTSPGHVFDDNKLFILPSGGSVLSIPLPVLTVVSTSIPGLPIELVQAVILYTAIHGTLQNISTNKDALAAVSFNSFVAPTTITAPSFTFTSLTTNAVSITTVIDLSAQLTQLSTYLDTNNDFELAQGKISDIQTRLAQFIQQTQLALEQALANAKDANDVEKTNSLENLKADIEEYSAKLQKYSADLSVFSGELQQEVQRVSSLINQLNSESQQLDLLLKSLQNEYSNYLKLYEI